MHKQSFAECHSLATKAPLTRPSMHFSSKIPEVSKKNSWSFQLKPQEFNRVGGKRSSFLPTFVFRPLTPPYVPFGIRRFLSADAI